QPAPDRSVVPDDLVARAYETGRVTGASDGLLDTPIILVNVYTDDLGDIHDRVRSFSILDRLSGEGGDWRGSGGGGGVGPSRPAPPPPRPVADRGGGVRERPRRQPAGRTGRHQARQRPLPLPAPRRHRG